eukprot:scaffold1234_cov27-Cyclotella_meneghiniana.AAC.1
MSVKLTGKCQTANLTFHSMHRLFSFDLWSASEIRPDDSDRKVRTMPKAKSSLHLFSLLAVFTVIEFCSALLQSTAAPCALVGVVPACDGPWLCTTQEPTKNWCSQ